jgi:hypothetical protein
VRCATCKGVGRFEVMSYPPVDVLPCTDCDGSGLDKTRLEAAARAAFTQRHPEGRWNRQKRSAKKKWLDTTAAAIKAYLDHTEETP